MMVSDISYVLIGSSVLWVLEESQIDQFHMEINKISHDAVQTKLKKRA